MLNKHTIYHDSFSGQKPCAGKPDNMKNTNSKHQAAAPLTWQVGVRSNQADVEDDVAHDEHADAHPAPPVVVREATTLQDAVSKAHAGVIGVPLVLPMACKQQQASAMGCAARAAQTIVAPRRPAGGIRFCS